MKCVPVMALMFSFGIATIHAQGVSQIVVTCTTPAPESKNTNGCLSSQTEPIVNGETGLFVGGFWIWCQSPGGGTPYGPDCNGSVYVEEIDLATGVGKYEATSISGHSSATGPTGLQVTFTSSDGDLTCTVNVPTAPTKGNTNILNTTCGGDSITFLQAGVQVTGH